MIRNLLLRCIITRLLLPCKVYVTDPVKGGTVRLFVQNNYFKSEKRGEIVMTKAKTKYSKEIAELIKEFLTAQEWRYSFDDGIFRFELGTADAKGFDHVSIFIVVHENDYVVHAIPPLRADSKDKEQMATLAEFITRTNYNLVTGCLLMDFRDGELQYKTDVDCDHLEPSEDVLRNSIYCPVAMLELHSHGLIGIMFQGMTALEAVTFCKTERIRMLLRSKGVADDKVEETIARLQKQLNA